MADMTTPPEDDPGDATETSRRKEADTANDLSGGPADDAALADLIDYLEACCGNSTQGWLHVGVGHRPHLNDRGKYDHERFEPKPFRWPDEAKKAVEFILAESQNADVWLCPNLMLHDWFAEDGKKKTGRRKGKAVSLLTVHADIRCVSARVSSPGYLENGELSFERATKATWYGYADP